jgi:F-type H+-transporting ATPase subunit b
MLDFSVTFVITLINIVILFFILRAILFKPVTKFMEARTEKVRSSLEEAEKDRAQAKELLEQYGEKLRQAQDEGTAILRRAEERARLEAERIITEGKAGADKLLADARKQLEAEQRAAMAAFKAEAAALVVAAAGRLLQREFGGEDRRQYAGLLLKELGKD